MRGALLFLAAAVALAFPQPADAQSFHCHNARAAYQFTICRHERLLRLDERMTSILVRLREDLGRRGARDLEDDHDRWQRRLSRCGPNPECIEDAYRRRIDELRDYRRRY
jgi:uncharacterized protein